MDEHQLPDGIYEEIVSLERLGEILALEKRGTYSVARKPVDFDAASAMLEHQLRGTIASAMSRFGSFEGDLNALVYSYNRIVSALSEETGASDLMGRQIATPPTQLLEVRSSESTAQTERPRLSMNVSTLFTGQNRSGLSLADELRREILSADSIELLVSFIKLSGLNLIYDALEEFTQTRQLKVITTTYMGVTDPEAVERLAALPNTTVRVSYDNRNTRLHAKAYIFHRNSGYSTAYIGSSNLSGAAVRDGLEWNVKATERETPHILQTARIAFASYWSSPQFHDFDRELFSQVVEAQRNVADAATTAAIATPPIHPFPFQQTILDRLEAERELHGSKRNLVIAATGTGKTVIAALDFARFREQHPDARLLFVAHREEILRQARDTFRNVLGDYDFGGIGIEGNLPTDLSAVFVSIQTLNSQKLTSQLDSTYYDYIVIDEFHHAAAPSYQQLLNHFAPSILLGLTATPERMDGQNVQDLYFGGRIAAEIRLPEAINRGLLVPFEYYCVDDKTDLSGLAFTPRGYDVSELENLYTFDDARTNLIITALNRYLGDLTGTCGLGFCVTVRHALFMADRFSRHGIPAAAIHGGTPKEERRAIRKQLSDGKIKFIFTVDVFNEGVDIPEVNTVLFLRPTESLTIFLQQLGRGLRLHEGKPALRVFDFIGQAHERYRFERKFRAILRQTTRSFKRQVTEQSFDLPSGCSLLMDQIVQERILANIESAVLNARRLKEKIQDYRRDGGTPQVGSFLEVHDDIEPSDLYRRAPGSQPRTFASLYKGADTPHQPSGTMEKILARVGTMDSTKQLRNVITTFSSGWSWGSTDSLGRTLITMLYYAVNLEAPADSEYGSLESWVASLRADDIFSEEVVSLAQYRLDSLGFVPKPVDLGFNHGLELHASYAKTPEVLAALGVNTEDTYRPFREGVIYLPDRKTDVFFVTLYKDEDRHTETTMYEDYALSESAFHWQSQSTTSEESPTGRRYISHRENNSQVLIMVRETKDHPYCFLGRAHYSSHEGSKPMSITWTLEEPMPESVLIPALAVEVA